MFEIERSYSCVPNKRRWVGVLIIGGGWKISKIQIAGVNLNFPGVLKMKKFNFFVKRGINCLMFTSYNQKKTRVKSSIKKYQTK